MAGKETPSHSPELFILLNAYDFPGNIRELQHMVSDAVSHHDGGILSIDSFRREIEEHASLSRGGSATDGEMTGFAEALAIVRQLPALHEVEPLVIAEALKRAAGNKNVASQLLNLSRDALTKRISRMRKSAGEA